MKLLIAVLILFTGHNLYAFNFTEQIIFDYEYSPYAYNANQTQRSPLPQSQKVRLEDRQRCFKLVKNELTRYPQKILKIILDKVVILSEIQFEKSNDSYAGLAYYKAIFIKCNRNRDAFNTQLTLHHEISSLLISDIFNLGFNFDQFLALNINGSDSYLTPENYFGPNTSPEVTNFFGLSISPKMNKRGFLTEYSHTDLLNDVNMIAEYLMVTPGELNNVINYPVVRNKINFVRDFYKRLGIKIDEHLINF